MIDSSVFTTNGRDDRPGGRALMDRLRAMRVFARVAELGSFARAADALALSPARVSEAVAGLERALGARLLHRTTRRQALSDDGRSFYERAARIVADVDEAEALVKGGRSLARGRLRIDMPVALARLYVVPALPRWLTRHPGLELEVRLENRDIDLIAEGIDCAITYGPPADTALVARRIGTTHLVTCAAPSYLARHAAPRAPEALARHNAIAFLSLATGRPTNWELARAGERRSHRPTGNLAFNSMEACVDAARAGLGITQVLSSLAHDAIVAGALVPVLLDWAVEGPAVHVVYPPNRQQSARIRAFVDFAAAVFAEADAGWKDIAGGPPAARTGRRARRIARSVR
ncbi:MAG TPA: LysR family transcriptional regulator [Polyangia bacterium]|nr:LysR family transcriptional regulator [Polyangia bacterium]